MPRSFPELGPGVGFTPGPSLSWSPHDTAEPQAVAGSINFELRDEDIECEWFLITEVKLLLAQLPPWARVMGFDLEDAYQHLTNLAEQRRRLVFQVAGLLYVWLRGMFGICTMAAIFGQLCDVTCAWLELTWPTVVARHFADDHLVADVCPTQTLSSEAVLSEVQLFGWSVHPTKRFSWSRQFKLLGFWWDLDTNRVRLTAHKQIKYKAKIERLLSPSPAGVEGPKHTYHEVSSVVGSLVHTCAIFPERRSRLNALYAHRNRYRPSWRSQKLYLPTDVRAELADWLQFLQTPLLSASFDLPAHHLEMRILSDASDGGCGIVVDGRAQAWSFADYDLDDDIDISVKETWALHLALQAAVALGAHDFVATFHVDNLGVVYAHRKGRSRSKRTNRCLLDMAERAFAANIIISITYVASADNLADKPSRGIMAAFPLLDLPLAEPWNHASGAADTQ